MIRITYVDSSIVKKVFKWKSLLVKGKVLEQAYTNIANTLFNGLKIVRARMLFNGKI